MIGGSSVVERLTVNQDAAGSTPAPRVERACMLFPYFRYNDWRLRGVLERDIAARMSRGWKVIGAHGNILDGYRICFVRGCNSDW